MASSNITERSSPLLDRASRLLSGHVPRILVYHRFTEDGGESFERQLQHLQRHFTAVPMARLVDILQGKQPAPRNCIALTVDDGHWDFYEIAYPLLRKYGIPCTLYVTTNFVESRNWLWPDKLNWMLAQRAQYPDIRLAGESIVGHEMDAPRLWVRTLGILQQVDSDEVDGHLRQLALQLGIEVPHTPVRQYQACTWAQLREMEASGIVEIGGHTRNHPILSCVKPEKLSDEIDGCLEDINVRLGMRPRSFCYPNGQPADFNRAVKEAVAKSGFISACTAFYDRKHLQDRFELRRYSSTDDYRQFQKAVEGLQYWGALFLKRDNINGSGSY